MFLFYLWFFPICKIHGFCDLFCLHFCKDIVLLLSFLFQFSIDYYLLRVLFFFWFSYFSSALIYAYLFFCFWALPDLLVHPSIFRLVSIWFWNRRGLLYLNLKGANELIYNYAKLQMKWLPTRRFLAMEKNQCAKTFNVVHTNSFATCLYSTDLIH